MTKTQGARALASLTGLGKRFGPKTLFRELDMRLHAGETVLVVGRNGAGKSTLLRVVAGLSQPSFGSVELDVAPGKMAYLGHKDTHYAELSTLDNLLFWARLHRVRDAEGSCEDLLRRVGLSASADDPARVLSRGQSQRLSLAKVLLCAPELVLLDEPDTGLDVASRDWLRQEIAGLTKAGAGVLWVSHDAARDARLADRVLSLQGKARYVLTNSCDFDPAAFALECAC